MIIALVLMQIGGCLGPWPPPPRESMAASDAVFAGVVQKIEAGERGRLVTFQVLKWWKGENPTREIQLRTSGDGTGCEFRVEDGRSYLVYSRRNRWGELTLSIGGRTGSLVCAKNEMAELGTPVQSYEEIDPAKLIEREQPYTSLQCIKIPLLIGERPAIDAQCYYEVDAVIDETGAVRDFKGITDRSKAGCPALDPKIIQAWRFKPATIDGKPVQVKLRAISAREPFTVADDAKWRAEAEAREKAKKK